VVANASYRSENQRSSPQKPLNINDANSARACALIYPYTNDVSGTTPTSQSCGTGETAHYLTDQEPATNAPTAKAVGRLFLFWRSTTRSN